jgi:hypothetical protein
MHRTAIIISIALFSGGVGLFVACGGSDATSSINGNGDGGGGDGASGSQNGNGTDGGNNGNGNGSDGGGNNGGGNEGGTGGGKEGGTGGGGTTDVDGGKPSDPGSVSCGTTTCATSTQVCCTQFYLDGGRTESCEAPSACTGPGNAGTACNEAADCDGGVCCTTIGGAECRKSCNAGLGEHELCRTQAECSAFDGGCNVLTCPGNQVEEICGHPFMCK